MASIHGTLSKPAIVVGCDYEATVVLDPSIDAADSDVVTDLGSATVTALIRDTDPDGTTIATVTGAVDVAASRTITLSMTDTVTGALEPGRYRWHITITVGGLIYPVTGLGAAWVRAQA